MFERQLSGVECHSANAAFVFDRRHAEWAAIFDVSADRMAEFGKMDADLIRATGFQRAFDFTVRLLVNRLECLKRFEMSRRVFSDRSIRRASAKSIAAVPDELRCDRLIFNFPRDQCQVFSNSRVLSKLMDDFGLSFLVASENKQPAGVAIDAMDRKQPRQV